VSCAFSLECNAPRAVRVTALEDRPRQLSYLLKSSFVRRVSVTDKRGRSNTLHFPLKNRQRAELATWLSSYPISTRLVTSGLHRRGASLQLRPIVDRVV
jgi:hypothetical protein